MNFGAVDDVVEGDFVDDVSGLGVNVHFMTIRHTRRCQSAQCLYVSIG